jgi:hypothetical protein
LPIKGTINPLKFQHFLSSSWQAGAGGGNPLVVSFLLSPLRGERIEEGRIMASVRV